MAAGKELLLLRDNPPSCLFCDSEILVKHKRDAVKKWCNVQCRLDWNTRQQTKTCDQCGQVFVSRINVFCSSTCAIAANTKNHLRSCGFCGNEFRLKNIAYEARNQSGLVYCSRSCGTRRYQVNESYFEKIDSHEKAYWLGFLFADGYQDGNSFGMELATIDRDHIEALRNALDAQHPIKTRNVLLDRKPSVTLNINSRKMCADLVTHGFTPGKTFSLKPPRIEPGLFPSLIRGYFDGDGHVSKDQYSASMHCASDDFRNWMLEEIQSFGVDAKVAKSQNGRNIVMTSMYAVLKFSDYIYSHEGSSLTRKRARFDSIKEEVVAQMQLGKYNPRGNIELRSHLGLPTSYVPVKDR